MWGSLSLSALCCNPLSSIMTMLLLKTLWAAIMTKMRHITVVGHPSEEAVVEAPQLNCGLRFKAEGFRSLRALPPPYAET